MWAHSQVMWVCAPLYSRMIWARHCDVLGQNGRYSRAVTSTCPSCGAHCGDDIALKHHGCRGRTKAARQGIPANDVRLGPILQRHEQRLHPTKKKLPEISPLPAPVLSDEHEKLRAATEDLRHSWAMSMRGYGIEIRRETVEHWYAKVQKELHERMAQKRAFEHVQHDLKHARDVLRMTGTGANI